MTPLSRARLIAILVPNALLWGAIASQYLGHLVPCEMCMWQRWPHVLAIFFALAAIVQKSVPPLSRWMTIFAGLAILASGGIGAFHAGVEWHWWTGPVACTAPAFKAGGDVLAQVMAAPVVMCDQAQWRGLGISLAGWNAIISVVAALAIFALATRKDRR
jgi:disulfide bond formation protein DsbB